ncbi:uncharacterized serine-rich protein C215.13-like [Vicia villosa]|uniref:uncharacterized serine-rich protein C215.13-like n=1 Tax=Vicia villosa TaxID=3911 RepID=UPI00273B94E6|nr:uncharacterized serine-rich protein C215.13-like [Vicia villosa]XP_058753090.1 uncharacterized serine-rich protein C215.13-like [Vicia villosa]
MFTSKSDQTQKTILQIKQDDKFFCRLLTKESSISNPSFRITLTVPFVWESQPGTPKHTLSQQSLPPLTPPPSYYSCKSLPAKKSLRSNLFHALFPKLNLKKSIMSSSSSSSLSLSPSNSPYYSSSSSSSCSSSNSSKVVPIRKVIGTKKRFLSCGSSFDFRGEEEHVASPTSTLCFGLPRSTSTKVNSGFLGFSKR